MPKKVSKIFDNIEQRLVEALLKTLHQAQRADFCIGYFHQKTTLPHSTSTLLHITGRDKVVSINFFYAQFVNKILLK